VNLASFNTAAAGNAVVVMMSCCASRRFATAMAASRPYSSFAAVEAAMTAAFESLDWEDVLEALAGHPRIGAQVSGQSAAEQSGVADSSRDALAAGNAEYEKRFGHVFLVCATGMSGEEMLAALRERLENDPYTERKVVTAQLRKITVLRARKALADDHFHARP
jgi:2-oxo-4-hydroxy-4-carboxy-5-ureidoimidazoline decarboxylase